MSAGFLHENLVDLHARFAVCLVTSRCLEHHIGVLGHVFALGDVLHAPMSEPELGKRPCRAAGVNLRLEHDGFGRRTCRTPPVASAAVLATMPRGMGAPAAARSSLA